MGAPQTERARRAELRLRGAGGGVAAPPPGSGSEPARGRGREAGEGGRGGGLAGCVPPGHGGRAELLGHLRRPPGPAAPLLLPVLPRVLPQLPAALAALAHRCHLLRVAGGLRTLHPLRGNGRAAPACGRCPDSVLEASLGSWGRSSPDLSADPRTEPSAGTRWLRDATRCWTAL